MLDSTTAAQSIAACVPCQLLQEIGGYPDFVGAAAGCDLLMFFVGLGLGLGTYPLDATRRSTGSALTAAYF